MLAGLFAVTVWLSFEVSRGLSLRVLLEEMLPTERHNVQLVQKFVTQFGGANTTLIAVRNTEGDIYDSEFLQRYSEIVEEIYYHPDAIRHLVQGLSLRKTKSVSGGGGRVEINAVMWPAIPQTDAEMERLRRDVKEQYRGLLVSDSQNAAMIVADFKEGTDHEALVGFVSETGYYYVVIYRSDNLTQVKSKLLRENKKKDMDEIWIKILKVNNQ